jgi:hypothetical protein
MFDSITKIVRSNQNGVMFRIGNGSPDTAVYSIYDLRTQQHSATGSLNMVKKRGIGITVTHANSSPKGITATWLRAFEVELV